MPANSGFGNKQGLDGVASEFGTQNTVARLTSEGGALRSSCYLHAGGSF